MASEHHEERLVQQITSSQDRLYAYILTFVPDREAARDILQETNLVLWRRRSDFRKGGSFTAWSCKVAFLQALASRRDKGRDRHFFSDDLMRQLAEEGEADQEVLDRRRGALRDCLEQLPRKQRWLIAQRYAAGMTVKVIAEMTGDSDGSIATTVYRIRNALRDCVSRKLAVEGLT